jgi:hypothetical protein
MVLVSQVNQNLPTGLMCKMNTRSLRWLMLTAYFYGLAALSYRIVNFPHFPLRDQTGELVWWTDALVYNSSFVAITIGILASSRLGKRGEHTPRSNQLLISTVVLGVVTGCLISFVLHTVNPALYKGWS